MEPNPDTGIVVSEIVALEGFSIFSRLLRDRLVTELKANRMRGLLLQHLQKRSLVIPLDQKVLTLVRPLVTTHTLRALDGIQLASAKIAIEKFSQPTTFVTSDIGLGNAATAEGFTVIDPNDDL